MSKKTPNRYINCSNCNKSITKFYYEIGFNDVICIDCLVVANHGFPEGKDDFVPCKKCLEPNIIWHRTENILGDEINGCYIHNTNKNNDFDFDFFD